MSAILSKGQKASADITALLRARNPLIWIITREEGRVEALVAEAAAAASYSSKFWDVAQGLSGLDGKVVDNRLTEAADALGAISKQTGRNVWIMRDLPVWINGPANAAALRQLRNLARSLPTMPRENAQAIIVLTTSSELPPELAGHATVIEWPLPDRAEIEVILDAAIKSLRSPDLIAAAAPNGTRDAAIDAAVGLSGEEASSCYARSLVQTRKIDPVIVSSEKRRLITRERVLEWYDPIPGGLDAVGGLENLKTWLAARKLAYSPKAREYGLPAPKGAILVGVPGCGKSLLAKSIATAWGVPLLRLDLGALKSKFVGESEGNLRKALNVIGAIGRCVVWLDEIEKAMQGATSGSADGGVSSDALGTILSWMQERTGEAFVIATANDVEGLPPELLRKGRFDEIWFVDLPTSEERVAVTRAALAAHGRSGADIDCEAVAAACVDFTGAEIAAIVPEALFRAFAEDGREVTTEDLIFVAGSVVPLAETAKEKIAKLREWAKTRARAATAPQKTVTTSYDRELDI